MQTELSIIKHLPKSLAMWTNSSQTWCLLLAEAEDYLFLVFLSPNGFSWLLWLRMALTPALDRLPGLGRTAQHDHDGTKLSVDGNSISGAGTKPLHEKSSMDHCSKEQAPWLSGPTGPLDHSPWITDPPRQQPGTEMQQAALCSPLPIPQRHIYPWPAMGMAWLIHCRDDT